jgi:flagellar basal-body rod modification protein FlgD
MMAVSAVSGGGTSSVKSPSQSLAANFDTFLKLLTTQLQNQDPLAPMDANEFTSQLVEFASVEQAIQTNSKLGELGELIESSGTSSAMGMLGREVIAVTDRVGLAASGDAQIRYRLPEAAAKITVTVLDAQGRAVRSLAGGGASGENLVRWDGLDGAGRRMAPGSYQIRVEAARADGTALAAEQYLTGTVEGIEPGADGITLVVAGATVPMSAVRTVREPLPTDEAA